MATISDPVHGYVKLDDLALDLVDTPQMQRLRWIKQLGLANLVYPGANHTRFEHSLGAFHLASRLAHHLELDREEQQELRAAVLLHDVGHGPLSHVTESVLATYLRRDHENVNDLLRKNELGEVLNTWGLDPARIQRLIKGETSLGQIVNGEMDVDRMDYLVRDAHYTGVAYGVIDYQRLMEMIKIYRGQLVVEEGGIHAAESLLVSRLLMYPTVYYHHVSRIAQSMIESGILCLIEEHGCDPGAIKDMCDQDLISAMSSAGGYPFEIVDRIRSRRLFKRAVYVGKEGFESSVVSRENVRRIAGEIAEEANVDPRYVLVDRPRLPRVAEGNVPVLVDGEVRSLREVSPLATILERAHHAAWRLGVYTTEEDRERVGRAARSCLNIKRNPIQKTFAEI